MKYALLLTLPLCFAACDRPAAPAEAALSTEKSTDLPLLPVKKGDTWIYEVRLEIPAGVAATEAPAVDSKHRRTRVFLGKVVPGQGLPETDCFEVTVPGSPTEREFVDIADDRILMRGSLVMSSEAARPLWMAKPVPFVIAGMKPGTESPEIRLTEGEITRRIQVVAREDVTVPAGKFPTIRLLMTGKEGPMELRRTTWFAPGTGIVREEKIHYRADKLVYRETHELVETSVGR